MQPLLSVALQRTGKSTRRVIHDRSSITHSCSTAAPDIPSIAEAGVPDYDFSSWFGVLAPAGTPRHIVNRLNIEITQILKLPEIKNRLATDGTELVTDSPEEFSNYLKAEANRWARVIKDAGINAD